MQLIDLLDQAEDGIINKKSHRLNCGLVIGQ